MVNRSLLLSLLLFIVVICSIGRAENICPPGVVSDKLICLLPQVYGTNGFVLGNPQPLGQFQSTFLSDSLKPLNSALARQTALLPLASPTSGIIHFWNVTGELSSSSDSLGPIFGERAETIGKSHIFLGFGYQYFKFDTLDGQDVKKLPIVLTQQDFNLNGTICSVSAPDDNPSPSPSSTGRCGFIRDVIRTENRIDLKIQQFTTFITYGLTNRFDVAMVIPIASVRMGISSNATIVNNSSSLVHIFPSRPGCGSSPTDPPPFIACRNNLFSSARSASGIGDITLRIKGTLWNGEQAGVAPGTGQRAALALGVDIRLPTGDALNFLGAGAVGVKPFVVWSYRARITPHALVGYEINGDSVIAGDTSTGSKERLPGQLTYSGGADMRVREWLTVALDLFGQQVFQVQRTSATTFVEPGPCTDSSCSFFGPRASDPSLAPVTGTFNATNFSVGVKTRPFGSWTKSLHRSKASEPIEANDSSNAKQASGFLLTGNLLFKLNDGGLRANIVPMVGLSYTF